MKGMQRNQKNNIFQIYFRPEQKAGLTPEFIPYFKAENEEIEWREYWTFAKNQKTAIASNGLTGYLSWKFEKKSGVAAKKFLRFIADNPGFDVYFINPFPLDSLLFDNVWDHGGHYHPRLKEFSAELLKNARYEVDIRNLINTPDQTAYSNYWVGNSKFWKAYMSFTQPAVRYMRTNLTPSESEYLYSLADKVSNCSHIPFVIERLFTTLLVVHPEIKFAAYQYDAEDLKNRYSWPERLCYKLLSNLKIRRSWPGRHIRAMVLRFRKLKDSLR